MTPTVEPQPDDAFALKLQQLVVRHSLGWLVAANLVGVLLALLLVHPQLGDALGEYTYGRWAALHLNWQLYGWCSLPLIGVLLRHFLRAGDAALAQAHWALLAWSLALVIGGFSWLEGETTGKLFLDWTGPAKIALVGAQAFLWIVLAMNWRGGCARDSRLKKIGDVLLLAMLATVPPLLCWSASRRVYPPIDPGTGGPTGASLLGSTLGIVLLLSLVPKLLGRTNRSRAATVATGFYFALSCLVYALIDHHNSSHHDWRQLVGMGTLLGWIPLSAIYLRGFDWSDNSCVWLRATLCWWGLLVVSGFVEFCPGILDRVKFTHSLVAHAHLAMAGLLSSLNMLMLSNLASAAKSLPHRILFAIWQGGTVFHLAALAAIASFEAADPGWLLQRGAFTSALYFARLFAGLLMTAASVMWFTDSCGTRRTALLPVPA